MTNKVGRPRHDTTRRVPITLAMSPAMVGAIDAANKGYSRSEFIERMMRRALEDV